MSGATAGTEPLVGLAWGAAAPRRSLTHGCGVRETSSPAVCAHEQPGSVTVRPHEFCDFYFFGQIFLTSATSRFNSLSITQVHRSLCQSHQGTVLSSSHFKDKMSRLEKVQKAL